MEQHHPNAQPLFGHIVSRFAEAAAVPNNVSLTPEEAAAFLTANALPTSRKTLAKWRCLRSDGPKFRKVGKQVIYTAADLRVFLGISEAA